jgi:hypothetical protein
MVHAQVLGKRDVDLQPGDALSVGQFVAAWAALGVDVSRDMADAVYNKYGHTSAGRLPVKARGPGYYNEHFSSSGSGGGSQCTS